jgi:Tol biopolymer transport system component
VEKLLIKLLVVVVGAGLLLALGALFGSHPTPRPLAGLRWTDETPSWSPDASRIVFASNRAHPRSGIDQLYLMKADGSDVRRLTRAGEDAREPNYSPDGKRIVYAGNVLDSSRDFTNASGIFTISATGKDVRFLTAGVGGDADQPAWSPNGRWIAFLDDTNPNAIVSDRVDLYVMHPDGSGRHLLAINVDGWAFSWSPDSGEVAVAGADERLYRIRVNTTVPIRIHGDNVNQATTDIAWSPDGSKIAYVRGQKVVSSCFCDADGLDVVPRYLWVLDLRKHERRRLRQVVDSDSVGGFATTIIWLRRPRPTIAVFDGNRIRFVGVDGRSWGSVKTVNWGQLSPSGGSPGGTKLLLVDGPSSSYTSAIYVANIDSGSVRQVTQRSRS